MNYGYTDEEWEDISQGKWNDRYFDVVKRHIELGNIHFPHLKYLIKLVENQQEEIIRTEKEKLQAFHNGYQQGASDEKMSWIYKNQHDEDYEVRGFSEEDSFTKKML